MLTKDAVAYFGGVARLARVLRCSGDAIYMWPERVPALRQLQLQAYSKGRLKAEEQYILRPNDEWVDPSRSARQRWNMSKTKDRQTVESKGKP